MLKIEDRLINSQNQTIIIKGMINCSLCKRGERFSQKFTYVKDFSDDTILSWLNVFLFEHDCLPVSHIGDEIYCVSCMSKTINRREELEKKRQVNDENNDIIDNKQQQDKLITNLFNMIHGLSARKKFTVINRVCEKCAGRYRILTVGTFDHVAECNMCEQNKFIANVKKKDEKICTIDNIEDSYTCSICAENYNIKVKNNSFFTVCGICGKTKISRKRVNKR